MSESVTNTQYQEMRRGMNYRALLSTYIEVLE